MTLHPFSAITEAPADAILGLTEQFKADSRSEKINLTVGVYRDGEGNNPVLSAVKQAEKMLLESETTKDYLPIPGDGEYGTGVRSLLFGEDHPLIQNGTAVTMQTPGGTGALKVGADFLASLLPGKPIWVSDPTWANHRAIFTQSGVEVKTYPYLDKNTQGLDFTGMVAALEGAAPGDAVLLHACCHNPSGVDLSTEQWETLAKTFVSKKLVPFFDNAYQGLGTGMEEDAAGIRAFAREGLSMLAASSFSKNFGLYRERVGALTLVAGNEDEAARCLSQLKVLVRTNYSNPPAHGGLVVKTVLANPELKKLWTAELAEIRERIRSMRHLFVKTLAEKGVKQNFEFLIHQNGMFSFSGISKDKVIQLRENYGIYMLDNGRINVAGMNGKNMETLCQAIAEVLSD